MLIYFGYSHDGPCTLYLSDDIDCLPPDIRGIGTVEKTPDEIERDIPAMEQIGYSVCLNASFKFYETNA